jgi:Na+-transporting methylmalonyl-CoA/oxaloacetate decarboxylase gamma subunit
MTVWSIAMIGVVVVFLVLWALTTILTWLGKFAVKRAPQDSTSLMDVAVITAVMRHRGVKGSLKVTRID